MFDTRDLLGAMLGTGMGGRNPRMGGPGGMLGGGGGMGGMPGGLGGMLGGGGGMPGGLGGMLGGGGGGLGGGGLGGLGGMLGGGGMGGMGRGGGMGGGLQGALIGMLGGVAMSALQRRMMQGATRSASADEQPEPGFGRRSAAPAASDYDARQGSDPTGASSMGGGEPPELDEGRAQLLVRVMIAAANADMRIDQEEHSRIMGKLEEAGANDAARRFVEDEMRRPMSIDDIAREANSPDLAAQAYAAALAAIDVDKAMERRFLQSLAQRLGLDAEIVAEIHDQLGHPRLAA